MSTSRRISMSDNSIDCIELAGANAELFESHFATLENKGIIQAKDAAKFLKRSELSDKVLSKIWDMSDTTGMGYLNRTGFYTALKLVSLAQQGHELTVANLFKHLPPPKLTGFPAVSSRGQTPIPASNNIIPSVIDWKMTHVERLKYEALFDSLKPLNGVIQGAKVKGLLTESKLPFATLGKIWDLADMDKDGSLNRHEFTVAMHLVYKALENYTIPNSLPPELLPLEKRKESVQGLINSVQTLNNGLSNWVVSNEEKTKYDNLFLLTDVDKDGYVSGNEIKDVFLQSGVHQTVLASIWGLCDMKQSGKLNAEQFSLAMWLINRKLKGIDPPASLTPEMIPPSMRQQASNKEAPYSNPEIDMISQDIEELMRDKHILEGEIYQKEAAIKIKSGEAVSLQGELDTLAATLKQLDNQKGEAGRRLNDLKNQVEKLKEQAEEQEALINQQESELMSKKKELENLKSEEMSLNTSLNDLNSKLTKLSDDLQESQLTISQAKTKMEEIQDHQRQVKEAIELLETALSSNETSISNRYLEIEPEFRDPAYSRLINTKKETEVRPASKAADLTNGTRNSFNDSGFKTDPFANSTFTTSFADQPSKMGFGNDPFNSFSSINSGMKNDPFDPFGNTSTNQQGSKSNGDPNQDAFGCEPFGAPAPALPPKNKQPPPRPAPPRPAPPPSHVGSSNPDSFADFSAFNSKDINLEFTEDPFKDYRYEDTFNIEDPFSDSIKIK